MSIIRKVPTHRTVLLAIATILCAAILLFASTAAVKLTISTDASGSRATLNDAEAILTATLDLSTPAQPYYSQPQDSEFYHQSDGPLAWLETVQVLRPALILRDITTTTTQVSVNVSGVGAEAGSSSSVGLIFRANDGQQYLVLAQPESRRVGWYRWQGQRGDLLATAVYHPNFAPALISLLAELALIYFYALAALLFIIVLALVIRLIWRSDWRLRPNLARLVAIYPVVLFFTAFSLTTYIAYAVLDAMPHVQDSAAYLFQAKVFAGAALRAPDPGLGLHDHLQQSFMLFYKDNWFSKYPPGYSLVLALGVLIGQPAIIDPLCGAVSLVFVYLAARRLFGVATAVIAGLLGLVSPFFLTMSASFLAHSVSMLGSIAFLYFFIVAIQEQDNMSRWRKYYLYIVPVLAGLSIGWVAITRQLTALGIATPFVIYGLVQLAAHHDWPTLRRYLLIVVGAIPPLLIMLGNNYVLTGSPLNFAVSLQRNFDTLDRVGFGTGVGGDPLGHSPALGLANALVYLRELAQDLFGWPAPFTFIFIIFGAGFIILNFSKVKPSSTTTGNGTQHAARSTQHAALLLIAAPLGLAVAYYFWWAASRIFGPRYWYEMLPFLFILTALGVISVGRSIGKLIGSPTAGMTASGLLLTLLIAYSLLQFTPSYVASFHGYNGLSPAERDAVATANLHHAVIFVQLDPATAQRDFTRVFWLNNPVLMRGDIIWLRDLGIAHDRATMQQYFSGWSGWRINRTQLAEIKEQR